jgi:hypothetical protein
MSLNIVFRSPSFHTNFSAEKHIQYEATDNYFYDNFNVKNLFGFTPFYGTDKSTSGCKSNIGPNSRRDF